MVVTRTRGPRAFIGLALMSFGLSAFNSGARQSDGWIARLSHDVPRCEVTGRVVGASGALGTFVSLESVVCEAGAFAQHPGTVVMDHRALDRGSRVAGSGWLVPLGRSEFDRARTRAGAEAELEMKKLSTQGPLGYFERATASVRAALRVATEDQAERVAGTLRGLSIGDTEQLDRTTTENFRRAGLSHLLAVSGSNVAIVFGAVLLVTGRWGLRARVLASAVALLLFVGTVGPDPSVLRAGAMGALSLVALALGRRTEATAALGVAVIVILAAAPRLVYAPGLHLSVAATAGIVLGSRRLLRRFTWLPHPLGLLLAATLAAQIAVAPVVIATFNALSVVSPVANILAGPAVAPATVLTLVAGLLYPSLPEVADVLVSVASWCARWIVWCADAFGTRGFATVHLPSWAALPTALMAGLWLFRPHKVKRVDDYFWTTQDSTGEDIDRSQAFPSKADAEDWMGTAWRGLLDAGGKTVTLFNGDRKLYTMGLEAK